MHEHVLERSTKWGVSGGSDLMGKMMGMGMNDSSEERTIMEVTEIKRDLDAMPGRDEPDKGDDGGGMPDLDSLLR